MRWYLWALLGVVGFLASCSPPVPDLDDIIDWCYEWDFGESLGMFNLQSGQLIPRVEPDNSINPNWGIKTFDNLIVISGQYDRIVTPRFVRITLARPTIVSGVIDIAGIGNVFGIVINQSGSIPANVEEIELVFEPRYLGDGSSIVNAQIESSDVLLLRKLEVFGTGASPFPDNPCAPSPTPAPTATQAPNTPTPVITETPTPTPTNTPTPAPTWTPQSGCSQAYWAGDQTSPIPPTFITTSSPGPVSGIYGPTNFAGWEFSTGQWVQFNLGGMSTSASHGVSFNRSATGTYTFTVEALLNGVVVQSASYGATFWNSNSVQTFAVTVNHDAIRVTATQISGGRGFLRNSTFIRCNMLQYTPTPTPSNTPAVTATFTSTPVPTSTPTATRTPIPTMTAPPPTRTPIIVGTPTPRPTSTPLPATFTPGPTATIAPSRTPMPRATIETSTPIPRPSITPNSTQDPNAALIEELRDGFGDLRNGFGDLLGGIGDLIALIANAFMSLFEFLGGLLSGIIGLIGAVIGLIIEFIRWFLDSIRALIEALEEIIGIIRYIIEIAIGLFRTLIAYLIVAARLVSDLIGALIFAPPRPIPGLPLCVTDPLAHDICALYWAADWTLFAPQTPGAVIVPILLIIMNVYVVLTFVRRAFSVISRGQKVTNVS